MYDTRDDNTVSNMDGIIRVATPTPVAPKSVYFLVGSPGNIDGVDIVDITLHQYFRLDLVPDPLRQLVRELINQNTKRG